MADKKSFVMYKSWGSAVQKMSDEQAGKLLKAIYELQDNPEASVDDMAVGFVFEIIREKMAEDSEAYEDTCKRRAEAGKKGNEARWGADIVSAINSSQKVANDRKCDKGIAKIASAINSSQKSQMIANVADTESDTDTESVSENDTVPPTEVKKERDMRKRFAPPSVDEVTAYCHERKNNIDPAGFVDFYTSKGWKVGSEPMKDWKAALRNWERREGKNAGRGDRASPFDSNDYLLGIIDGGG